MPSDFSLATISSISSRSSTFQYPWCVCGRSCSGFLVAPPPPNEKSLLLLDDGVKDEDCQLYIYKEDRIERECEMMKTDDGSNYPEGRRGYGPDASQKGRSRSSEVRSFRSQPTSHRRFRGGADCFMYTVFPSECGAAGSV